MYTHTSIQPHWRRALIKKKGLKKKNDNDHRLCNTHPMKQLQTINHYLVWWNLVVILGANSHLKLTQPSMGILTEEKRVPCVWASPVILRGPCWAHITVGTQPILFFKDLKHFCVKLSSAAYHWYCFKPRLGNTSEVSKPFEICRKTNS